MKILKYITLLFIFFFLYSFRVNAISNIKVDNYNLSPTFSKNTYVYNIFVLESTESVNIEVFKEDNEIVVESKTINLKSGLNKHLIEVENNGVNKTYTLNIYKGYNEEYDSSDAFLRDLNIEGYDISFESEIYTYEITLEEITESLNIEYISNNPNAGVKMIGNSNFKIGENIIDIIVTSEDKKITNNYKIIVENPFPVFKEDNENFLNVDNLSQKELMIVRFVIAGAILIILWIIFRIIFKKRKKKK